MRLGVTKGEFGIAPSSALDISFGPLQAATMST
jgi:hypothetical protein